MTTCNNISPVAQVDLAAYRGDSFLYTLIWQDSDGNPIDISGSSVRMQIRESKETSPPIFEATSPTEITIDGPNGSLSINIPGASMDISTPNNVYDLELTESSGDITTLIQGSFKVVQDVSRD